MRGKRLLILLGLLAVGGFWFQRLNSDFLRIEREEEAAQIAATYSGLSIPEVMALRGIYQRGDDQESLDEAARILVDNRDKYRRDELAVLATIGHQSLVDELMREAGGDADAAVIALSIRPEAVLAVRFEKDAERYASRR